MASPSLRLRLRRLGRRLMFLSSQTLLRMVGFRRAKAVGGFIGNMRFRLGGKGRRRMQADLAHALGLAHDDPAIARLLHQAFRTNDGAVLEMMAVFDQYQDETTLARRCQVKGVEHLETALLAGRGAILLAAHMGNQALALIGLARAGRLVSVVYKQSRMGSEGFFERGLELYGIQPILANSGIRAYGQMLGALKQGRIVVIMLDQGVKEAKDGLVQRFLGKDMPMPAGPAQLARASRAPVLLLTTTASDPVWQMEIGPPVELGGASLEGDLQALLRASEEQVRRHPGMWSWHHRRWRRFPAATTTPAKEPA